MDDLTLWKQVRQVIAVLVLGALWKRTGLRRTESEPVSLM